MFRRKNGFIVSLKMLIIILIITFALAVPIVLRIISNSRKNAMLDIAQSVNDASYRYFIAHLGMNSTLDLEKEEDMDKIGLAGAKPNGGTISIDSTGNISFAIYNEYWCVIKKNSSAPYEIKKYVPNECVLPNEKE